MAYFSYEDPEQAHLLSHAHGPRGPQWAPFKHMQYRQVHTLVEPKVRKNRAVNGRNLLLGGIVFESRPGYQPS